MQASRLARIVIKGPKGDWERLGSGYRITATVVLTVAHVLNGASLDLVEVTLDVGGAGEWSPKIVDVWADQSGTDLGVVIISPRADEHVALAHLGRVSRERDAVLRCVAVGFPLWKLRRDVAHPFRDLHQAEGSIPVLSNRREATLEIGLDRGPGKDPDPERSPWEGMSGAAVLVDGRVVGVVAEHHRSEGLIKELRLNRVTLMSFP